jgi:Acetyltransferases
MVTINKIADKDEKTSITLEIMNALPEWFSPPEDIARKAVIHRDYPFFAAMDGGAAIGFITLKLHNKYAADIYDLGVLKRYHGQGAGRQLLMAAEAYCRKHGYIYLTVKTLDESAVYEPYNRTRAFYYKNGFIPLEVIKHYWNEENPCLYMVKYLAVNES